MHSGSKKKKASQRIILKFIRAGAKVQVYINTYTFAPVPNIDE